MTEDISKYLHKHTRAVTAVVVVVFLLLAAGEYYLYRQIMHVNRMVSEGLSQVKEEVKQSTMMRPTPMMSPPTATPMKKK